MALWKPRNWKSREILRRHNMFYESSQPDLTNAESQFYTFILKEDFKVKINDEQVFQHNSNLLSLSYEIKRIEFCAAIEWED